MYQPDRWKWDTSIWGRASYRVAKPRGKIRPSRARGRSDLDRRFSQQLKAAADALIKRGLAVRRKMTVPDAPARFAQGYKRHKARDRDFFLTPAGLLEAEKALRSQGLMAEDEASCED